MLDVGQRFNRHDNYNRHVTGGTCGGGKTKLICPGEKFERIMNSTEKVFLWRKQEIQFTLLVSGLKTKRINRKTYSSRIMWARRGILCAPVCGKRGRFSREGNTG